MLNEDQSGWYGDVHIYAPAMVSTPNWATHERLSNCKPDDTVFPDCCLCKMRADETVCSISYHLPVPKGMSEDEAREWVGGHFAESYLTVTCGPGLGCNAVPRRRSSRHLREWRGM